MTLTTGDFIRKFNRLKQLEIYKNRENQDMVLEIWYETKFIQVTLNNLKRGSEKLLARVDLTKTNKYIIKEVKNLAIPNDILKMVYELILDLAQTPIEHQLAI